MTETALAFKDENATPVVNRALTNMMNFLRDAQALVGSADVAEVAAVIWGAVKHMKSDTLELAGKHYTPGFVRMALALSLKSKVQVLVRDERGRVAEIGIDIGVLNKLPEPPPIESNS